MDSQKKWTDYRLVPVCAVGWTFPRHDARVHHHRKPLPQHWNTEEERSSGMKARKSALDYSRCGEPSEFFKRRREAGLTVLHVGDEPQGDEHRAQMEAQPLRGNKNPNNPD